jgi:hypothetical protein
VLKCEEFSLRFRSSNATSCRAISPNSRILAFLSADLAFERHSCSFSSSSRSLASSNSCRSDSERIDVPNSLALSGLDAPCSRYVVADLSGLGAEYVSGKYREGCDVGIYFAASCFSCLVRVSLSLMNSSAGKHRASKFQRPLRAFSPSRISACRRTFAMAASSGSSQTDLFVVRHCKYTIIWFRIFTGLKDHVKFSQFLLVFPRKTGSISSPNMASIG